MSAESEMKKSLAKWLTKGNTLPAPPGVSEHRPIAQPDSGVMPSNERIKQLNLKIPNSTYRRIKGLAYRDRLSLVAMLDEMLALYEQAHGPLEQE